MFKALDLFCGAGGAGMGLYRAGFDVTGVDINPQPRYPFNFIQADAMTFDLSGYDFIWASPVCKRYSTMSRVQAGLRDTHPDQIARTRDRLRQSHKLYCIENVQGAPLLPNSPFLCGLTFGLELLRHRYFECNFHWQPPIHIPHRGHQHFCIVGHGGPANQRRWKKEQAEAAMGINWMTVNEIVEAIPPVYAEFVARFALQLLNPEPKIRIRALNPRRSIPRIKIIPDRMTFQYYRAHRRSK